MSRCWRCRSSSSFGNVGRSATSAMIGSASASRATGTCSRTADESKLLRGAEVGAEEIDGVGDLERGPRARAFLEHRGRQAGDAELAGRIVGACR